MKNLLSRHRIKVLILCDIILVNLAFLLAFYLRFMEDGMPFHYVTSSISLLAISTVIYLTSFYVFKLYNRIWSYASTGELLSIIYAVTIGTMGTIGADRKSVVWERV